MWKSLGIALAGVGLLAGRTLAEEPVELERALVRQAPAVIKKLKEKGYKNVGVLKFVAAKEGGKLTDNVGTLNMLLAQRLELALMLANTPKGPVGLIENASAVAQTIPGASHLGKENRLKLFGARYPLAWGSEKVQPDAFVTGLVRISGDLKLMTISLLAFDRGENTLAPILPDFTARNRPEQLVELGESFVMRGGFDEGKAETILAAAQKVKSASIAHPVRDPKAPVNLEIRYDGRAAPIEIQDGVARVPEPQEGQRLELVLRRDDASDRLKAVVKVNGENIFEKQRLPDALCWGWVLEPKRTEPLTISGYQMESDVVEKFRVASRAESKARELDYGADVGTITLTVFGERKGARIVPKLRNEEEQQEEEKVFSVAHLARPAVRPQNASALIDGLLADANRGLILEGQRVKSGKIETTKFDADPVPLMTLTVEYYKP